MRKAYRKSLVRQYYNRFGDRHKAWKVAEVEIRFKEGYTYEPMRRYWRDKGRQWAWRTLRAYRKDHPLPPYF
jgi:hypothetical protein